MVTSNKFNIKHGYLSIQGLWLKCPKSFPLGTSTKNYITVNFKILFCPLVLQRTNQKSK